MTVFTREQKHKAILREIAFRENVYRKRVAAKLMRQEKADEELAIMRAIALDYSSPPDPEAGFRDHYHDIYRNQGD